MVLALLLVLLTGCGDARKQTDELAAGSLKTTVGTLEQLGPHQMRSSQRRTESRPGAADKVTDELTELTWQDWDHFRLLRRMDGVLVQETVVADGVGWLRQGERWLRQEDAEPLRVQLRTSWNTWDMALGGHLEHLQFVHDGRDIIGGRPAQRYRVESLPPEQAPKPRGFGFRPTGVQGQVWLDEATALRLKAEVTATAQVGGATRTTRYELLLSSFGEVEPIRTPITP